MILCRPALTPAHIETVRTLFREYEKSVNAPICFQGFEKELAELPGSYASPRGRLLLAAEGERLAGCVALRPLSADVCEMKRLYVRDAFRGRGVGRLLAETLISEARGAGYRSMRLDTLPSMTVAIPLYRSLGFYEIAPYNQNPIKGTLFFEKQL